MTQDEIIEMAREAGWSGIYSSWTSPTNRTSLTVPVTMQQIEAFAKLVGVKEQKKWQDQTAVEIHEAVLEEQEPVGEVVNATDKAFECKFIKILPIGTKLYTTSPQRTWVGLTDEEMHDCWDTPLTPYGLQQARAMEAKLKEKNI